jgi:two-component system response regulator AtoC
MEDWCSGPSVAIDEGVPEMRAQPSVSASPRWLILVVGSNATLARGLGRCGYSTCTARDSASAVVALRQDRPDGVVLDLANAAASDGVTLLRRVRDIDAKLPVVVLTSAFAGQSTFTADAIRGGAFVLASPAAPEVVHAALQRLLGEQRQADVLACCRTREAERAGLGQLLGECVPMLRLKTQLRLLLDAQARCGDAPAVLLQGESGTGKEEVARALHFDGARRDRPFVRIDADELAAPDAEARLFGRERGAGALQRRLGLVEAADGGTLFIGDLATMAPALQCRIVQLLERGTMQRVGAMREVPVDVHVIAATRSSPEALLRAGQLRPDLHRRLPGVPLQLVPLRERGDDLWLLAHCFLERAAARCGVAPPRLSGAARALLALQPWPGNVRELRHALERAVLLQPDATIDSVHLAFAPAPRAAPSPSAVPELNLHGLEREALAQALQRAYGNVTKAARLLGISRDTMRYRIAKHALGAPRATR